MSFELSPRRGRRQRWRAAVGLLAVVATTVGLAASAAALVFHPRSEALEIAFPDAETVEARDFFLTARQRERIEDRSRARLESDLLTVYVGHSRGAETGYAILDTHIVRTLPETFMIVLSPDGIVRATHVLAFYEPTDYLPSERWLQQFLGKSMPDDLRVGRGIDGITGSTLSARAVADAIRRALAIHAVLLEGE